MSNLKLYPDYKINNLLVKGDLASTYGLPHQGIKWPGSIMRWCLDENNPTNKMVIQMKKYLADGWRLPNVREMKFLLNVIYPLEIGGFGESRFLNEFLPTYDQFYLVHNDKTNSEDYFCISPTHGIQYFSGNGDPLFADNYFIRLVKDLK